MSLMDREDGRRNEGSATLEDQLSDNNERLQVPFVTPPRKDTSLRESSEIREFAESRNQGRGDADIDPESAGEFSERQRTTPPPSTPRALLPAELHGRHKVPFTHEEDEALVRALWSITKAGKHRSSSKWKLVAERGGETLSRRTPVALKDRYRILSLNPKRLTATPDVQALVIKINRLVGHSR